MLFLSCFQVLVWLWLQLWKATAASSSCLRRWAWRRWVLRHIVWVPGSVRVTCLCHCSENILGIIVKHPSVWNKSHRNDQYWTWFFPFSTTGVLQDIGPRKKLDILSGMWQTFAPFFVFPLYRWTSWELLEPRSSAHPPALASTPQSLTWAWPGALKTRSPTRTSWTSTATQATLWLTTTPRLRRSWSSVMVRTSF